MVGPRVNFLILPPQNENTSYGPVLTVIVSFDGSDTILIALVIIIIVQITRR